MDAAFVKTGCWNEEILGVDSDHSSLCNLEVAAGYFQCICTFIESALQDARFKIIKGSPTCLRLPLFPLVAHLPHLGPTILTFLKSTFHRLQTTGLL